MLTGKLTDMTNDNKRSIKVIAVLIPLLTITLLIYFIDYNSYFQQKIENIKYNVHASSTDVTIAGIAVNNSSAKIEIKPISGAKDYRVFDISDPKVVKYAGLRHIELVPPLQWSCGDCKLIMGANNLPQLPLTFDLNGTGPQAMDFPNPEIEWNLLEDGKPHTLVVQALDKLGPVPQGNLYDELNSPIMNPAPDNTMMSMSSMTQTLGLDEGPTADGNYSINGQGPYYNNPLVIAQSQPFIVQANSNRVPVPSKANTVQTFLDTFDDSEASTLKLNGTVDDQNGNKQYTLNAGTSKAWDIIYKNADTKNSFPFIDGGHIMDVLFDGATPGFGCPNVCHNNHTVMAMSPQQTADFSNGKILHVTMEVDAHDTGRRWFAFNLAPANDPLTNWYTVNSPINNSDKAVFLQFFPQGCRLDIYNGPTSSTNLAPSGSFAWGAAGQADVGCYSSADLGGNGMGFDDRSRFDLFISQTHAALFQDGELIQQSDIPGGLPFTNAKVYYSHYMYHSAQEELTGEGDLTLNGCYLMNAFWYNDPQKGIVPGSGTDGGGTDACGITLPAGFGFRFSDERHWDNMGFEVLPSSDVPSSSDWSSFSSFVQPVSFQPATFADTSLNVPAPTINTTASKTYNSSITITGTKDSTVSQITVNNSSSDVTYTDSTHWQAVIPLNLGTNTFSISAQNSSMGSSSPLIISITRNILGDIDGDGIENLSDLSIFAKDWQHKGTAIINPLDDMNGDGIVDLTDFSIFAAHFTK